MRKKFFAGLALAAGTALLFGGCAGTRDAAEAERLAPLSISIGYWNIDRMSDVTEDALREKIEDTFAVSITPVSVDWSNYKEYYQMLEATDSLPDIFATLTISSNDANDSAFYEELIASGSIQPLPEDLSAWPNLEKMMESLSYTRYKDGRYYAIPRLSFTDTSLSCTDAAMIVRRDWMENLGLSDPQNLEEFIALVTAFAKEDPDGNGRNDTAGYNVNALSALGKWVILGIAPECNTWSWIEEDGRFIPSWYSARFRDVVTAYRTLYESGGLDPDFYTKNSNEILEDFAAGRLGALEYKSSPGALQLLKEQWDAYNTEPFEDCVDVLPIFAAADGTTWANRSSLFWSESFISSSAGEETLSRILSLYDYLLSDEGLLLTRYGLEGVDYTVDADGTYTCLADVDGAALSSYLEDAYPSIALFSGLATWGGSDIDFEINDMNSLRYGEACVALAKKDVDWNRAHNTQVSRPEEFLIFPKEASEEFSTANAFDAFIKCVVGDEDPLAMWDAVIKQFRADGLEEYIDRQNRNYKESNAE